MLKIVLAGLGIWVLVAAVTVVIEHDWRDMAAAKKDLTGK
jgi:hypothetical protein